MPNSGSIPKRKHKTSILKSSDDGLEDLKSAIDKYASIRITIQDIFKENYSSYGYCRIKIELIHQTMRLSEKVIQRLMKEDGLRAHGQTKKHYNSYLGEISPPVPNLIRRDFHANKPNSRWLTDITQFTIPSGKVYLSAILDCFDGLVVSWALNNRPDANLANITLKIASTKLHDEHPILHSDRSAHYRWPNWIELTKEFGIDRSMSKKGCSPDNSACEGFFGRLKNECFYDRAFHGISIKDS